MDIWRPLLYNSINCAREELVLNLERLEYFAAVAENLNFTRAAEDCHVAQTAISRHIAALESEVGCKLFYRTNRAVELTPAGKAFYSEILPMLEHYRRALEKARTAYSGPASALRLGIGQFEMGFVSQLFKEFHSLFRDIRLSVSQYPYSELMRRLEDGTVDVIFPHPDTRLPEGQREIQVQHIFTAAPGFLISAEAADSRFSSARRRGLQARDLSGENIVLLAESAGPLSGEAGTAQLEAAGIAPASITTVNSVSALFLMVKAGLGGAFIPSFMESELPEGLALLPQKILPARAYCSMILASSPNPAAGLFSGGILTSRTVMNGIKKRYLRQENCSIL